MSDITIDDIKLWLVRQGIGCIVLATLGGGWVATACGSLRTGDAVEQRPKRICRKCREALPRLRRVSDV
jgi:hypothetical protein